MSETTSIPNSTPIEAWHMAHGAKMTDFHGWNMPLYYQKVSDEVRLTRQSVGVFDLCHMGRIHIRGNDREAFAELIYTNTVAEAAEESVTYGFLCNEMGGVIDDVTLYKHSDYLMFVVNAANRDAVMEWMYRQSQKFEDVKIEDKTISLGMMAIQGPKAIEVLEQLTSKPLTGLKRYTFTLTRILGKLCLISRTGYSGEDGFEVYFGRFFATDIWEAVLTAAGMVGGGPVGLAARDALRLEAALPLHGHELSAKISPIEVGLDRFVDFKKGDFIGRRRLMDTTNSDVSVRLVAFEMMGKAIPRNGHSICVRSVGCGKVTSGGFSPTLDKAIGMGFVDQQFSREGQTLQIRIRDKEHPAIVVRRPFYRRKKT